MSEVGCQMSDVGVGTLTSDLRPLSSNIPMIAAMVILFLLSK